MTKSVSKRLILYTLLTAGLCFLPTLTGASPSVNCYFEHIGKKEGLPDMTVFRIIQDRKGYIWFGTRNGVGRYDGYRMTLFRHDPNNPESISHNDSGGVAEDADGNIWIRTWGGGLNRLDHDSGMVTVFKKNEADASTLSGNRVQFLYSDSTGTLWAGTFRAGLNRYLPKTETFQRFIADSKHGSITDNRIWAITETTDGRLWVGTNNGLHLFNPTTETFSVYRISNKSEGNQIRALFPDNTGGLWVGTDRGLKYFNAEKKQFTLPEFSGTMPDALSSGVINCIYTDNRGMIWAGTQGNGLFLLDPAKGNTSQFIRNPVKKGALSHNDVRSVMEDRSGNIWIGTRGGGVNKTSALSCYINVYSDSEGQSGLNAIHAMETDKAGNLFTGSWYHGLSVIKSDKPERISSQYDVNALLKTGSDQLLIGTWGNGLVSYNAKTGKRTEWPARADKNSLPPNTVVTALAPNGADHVWVGTRENGLFTGHIKTGRAIPVESDSVPGGITALASDDSGELWAGTGNGLYRVQQNTTRLIPADVKLSNPVITALDIDKNGFVWIGTYQGLTIYRPKQQQSRQIGRSHGMSGEQIKSLICDPDGNTWVTTESGLSRISAGSGRVSNYFPRILFNEGAAELSHQGKIYFGGENGYLEFFPQEMIIPEYQPSIRITAIDFPETAAPGNRSIRNRNYPGDHPTLNLKYNENYFSVFFTMTDYTSPINNIFEYRLTGIETEWHRAVSAAPQLTYSGIPAGKYHLEIRGRSSTGVKTKDKAILRLTISGPIWTKWYIQLTGAALLIGFLLLMIYFRFARIKYSNRQLQRLVDSRTKELIQQKKDLERLSVTDTLTGLYNRRGFSDCFQKEVSRHKRHKRPMTIVLCDIDNFKKINDTYGHDCGDMVLKHVSAAILALTRETDAAGRWGGEEFIILLPETRPDGGVFFAERLRDAVSQLSPCCEEERLRVTITIGVAETIDNESMASSVARADKALYKGKNSGKNCVINHSDLL